MPFKIQITHAEVGNVSADISEEFVMLKGEILDEMVDGLEAAGDEAGYSNEEIDKCAVILGQYLANVLSPTIYENSKKIMSIVHATVIALNELNAACDHSLIEIEQREKICELIFSAAANAGLRKDEQDITEEWREW